MSWQPGDTLADVEKDAIQAALRFNSGNKTATARALGCSVNTITTKLDQYANEEKLVQAAMNERKEQSRRELERFRGNVPEVEEIIDVTDPEKPITIKSAQSK